MDDVAAEIHVSAGIAAESIEDVADDENVDMAAVLGGNIRKAPVAATEPEAEPEHIATGA
jgi:small subunit ribosomal protein S2